MSRQYLRYFGLPAIVLATLYVACADPPKKVVKGGGGAPGTAGMSDSEAGSSETAGSNPTGGKGGSGSVADAGAAGEAAAGEGGEGGAAEASGGKGGSGGAAHGGSGSGGAQGGSGGALPTACNFVTIGKSKMPVPQTTTVVAKPSGAVGGLNVINWAGFKGALSYTFDDSLQNQVTHYQDLNAIGVHLTFYLVNFNQGSNPIWEQALADGHELGNHTVHHCNANGTNCVSGTFTNIDQELDDNTTFLKGKPGVTGVWSFASPYGDTGWVEGASKRFLVGRGVSDSGGIMPKDDTNAFNLPCHISNTNETAVGGFNNISDDVATKGSWRTILMHSVDPAINDGGYQPVQLAEAVAAITYTKNRKDVWADTVTSIGAYWRGQKVVAAAQAATVGSDVVYSWTLPDHFPPGQYLRATVTGGKVKQCGTELVWDTHGYYEINLDAGSVTISP